MISPSVAIPRGHLFLAMLGTCTVTLMTSLYVMSQYRYGEWVAIERDVAEMLPPILAVAAVLSGVISRSTIRATMPWLLPSLTRAAAGVWRGAVAIGIAMCIGWVVGVCPLVGWAWATATFGSPPFAALVTCLLWVGGVAVTAGLLTYLLRSIWVGPLLAFALIAAFYLGRVGGHGRSSVTRMPFLPFDGIFWNASGTAHVSSHLTWLRLGGSLLLMLVVVALAKAVKVAHLGRWVAARGLVVNPFLLVALGAIATASFGRYPIVGESDQPMRCQGSGPKACLLAAHAPDLPALTAVSQRLSAAVGPRILPRGDITEGRAGQNSLAPLVATGPYLRDYDPAEGFAQQLGSWIVQFDRCLERRPPNGDMQVTADIVADWFSFVGSGAAAPSSDDPYGPTIIKWNRDRGGVNAHFERNAAAIRSCSLRSAQLPSRP